MADQWKKEKNEGLEWHQGGGAGRTEDGMGRTRQDKTGIGWWATMG